MRRKSFWIVPILGLFAAIAAPYACADSFTDPNGLIIYPDGSVITTEYYVAPTAANGYDGVTQIGYEFTGGEGSATALQSTGAGEYGSLTFTESVTNVSIYWEEIYGLYMNFYSLDYGELGSFTEPVCATFPLAPCSGVVTFANPGRFEMTYETSDTAFVPYLDTAGVISALSYTITPTPEPDTGILMLAGAGLVILRRRRLAQLLQLDAGTCRSLSIH